MSWAQLRKTAHYYLDRLGLLPYNLRLLWFQHDLAGPRVDPPEGVTIEVAGIEQLQALEYCGGWFTREEAIERIQIRPCYLVLATRPGRIVGYMWVEHEEADLPYLDLRLPLPPDTAYISRLFIKTEERGQDLAGAILWFILNRTAGRGIDKVISCVDHQNHGMLAVHKKQNNSPYLALHYSRLWGWTRYRATKPSGELILETSHPLQAGETILAPVSGWANEACLAQKMSRSPR
jgi:GNAT superfamily N-acetyltransferase